jgi:hypothetical protein
MYTASIAFLIAVLSTSRPFIKRINVLFLRLKFGEVMYPEMVHSKLEVHVNSRRFLDMFDVYI